MSNPTLINQMVETQTAKVEKYTTFVVPLFPRLHSLTKRTYLGTFSWTQSKTRWISEPHSFYWQGVLWTPAELARGYLMAKHGGRRRRVSAAQYDLTCKNFKSVPMAAIPQGLRRLVYLDLKAAYWNIMLTGGWNVDYFPNKFVGAGESVSDFPLPEKKLARNILVSAGLPATNQIWDGKKIITKPAKNPLYNGVLWTFCMDVLNAIAWQMFHRAGAVYVHTDGYLIPEDNLDTALTILKFWDLDSGIKYRGLGEVLAPSRYRIEGKLDIEYPDYTPRPHYNINPPDDIEFLERAFYKLRQLRKKEKL